jgi:hypothetical protein
VSVALPKPKPVPISNPPLICGLDFIHAPLQLELRNGVVILERCLRCKKVRRPKE